MGRKLTPRQRAARKARAARGPLSTEARERLREAAIARRPWEASTGPRTAGGKAKSRVNAYRDGRRAWVLLPPEVRELVADLRAAERGEGPIPREVHHDAALMWLLARDELHFWMRGAVLLERFHRLERGAMGPGM